MKEKKIVIVGAGIVGLCSAYALNQKGYEVTVLDAGDGSYSCSLGNAGYISPSHIIPLAAPGIVSQGLKWMLNNQSPFYIKPRLDAGLIRWGWLFNQAATNNRVKKAAPLLHELCMRSQQLTEQILEKEGIDAGYRKSGLLMLCKTSKTLAHEIHAAEMATAMGQQAGPISKERAEQLNPGLQTDIAGAVYFENDSCFTPHIFMDAFRKLLIQKGVTVLNNHAVDSIYAHKGEIAYVQTGDTVIKGDEFVIAAGSWTANLVKPLGVKIPLQAGKGYSFMLKNPPAPAKTPAILTEGRVAMTPMLHGLRFAGTMEINGMNLDIKPNRINGIIHSIRQFFPQFKQDDFEGIEPWAGLRPCSPDGLPYVGRSQMYPNLIVAAGHAMLGVTLGAVTGELVTDTITGSRPFTDTSLLRVDRYQ